MALDMGLHLAPGAMVSEGAPLTHDLEPRSRGPLSFDLEPLLVPWDSTGS